MLELQNDNLAELVQGEDRVFVQFGASWCGNCRMLKPKVKQMADKNQGIAFVYVDAEKFPESRKLATVDNLPTFATYRQGELVRQAQGNKLNTIQELVDEIAGD